MPIEVTLGETKYAVANMNIGQIEDMSSLERADPKWPYKALEILMRRATPSVADIREVEAQPSQISVAIETIMTGSGYKLSDPNPVAPAEPGQTS